MLEVQLRRIAVQEAFSNHEVAVLRGDLPRAARRIERDGSPKCTNVVLLDKCSDIRFGHFSLILMHTTLWITRGKGRRP